jgi:hypothetical protein
MPDPTKKLYNKVDRIRTQFVSLYDDLRNLRPINDLPARATASPNDDLQNAWSCAMRELESAAVATINLADELNPDLGDTDDVDD